MDTKTLLRDEIQDELQRLGGIDIGTDKYKATVDGVAKLMDRAIEQEKLEIEQEKLEIEKQDKAERRIEEKALVVFDQNLKLQQMEEERKDRKIRNYLTLAGILIPVGVTIWGTNKTLKFEQTGTVTTIMGRGFINKLLPKK